MNINNNVKARITDNNINLFDIAKCRLMVKDSEKNNSQIQLVVYDNEGNKYSIHLHNIEKKIVYNVKNF